VGDAARRAVQEKVIMELARDIMLATASALLLALAGCATTGDTPAGQSNNALADSANALARNAQALADHSDNTTPVMQQDAHNLAESTFHFHNLVGISGTDSASARSAFESVSRNYQKVSEDVNQADTAEARDDLQPVTEAYQAVQHALQ
jgi:hypothetical protein